MSKHRSKKMIEDIFENTASANECTGLYQKVSLDKKEIAKFHKQYTEDEKSGD
ncbi:MAG: hypothetical protein K2N22_01680 [Clostridia bacterium]|nr:hypothetical protein [Clostridia bacterium]